MNKYLLIIYFLLLFSVNHFSQSEGKYYLYNTHPISLLPSNIPLTEDKVYLWADTTKIEESTVQVLLINNTEKELKFNGHQLARIQAEYKNNFHNWLRFIPFFYGWCGTAFAYDITIPPKEFYVSKEYFRPGIVKSEIRFTFYGDETKSSNSFFVNIDTSEIELAKFDDITYMFCDDKYLINIIEEMPKPYKEIPISQKSLHSINKDSLFIKLFNDGVVLRAMDELVKRFPDKTLIVLEPIAENKNYPYQDRANRIINAIKNKNK